jgi:DNA-binding NarL/FixJ family response regulator
MIDSIPAGSVSTVNPVAKPGKTPEKPAVAVQETAAKATTVQGDTVDLSIPAQVRLMQQQGLTVNQIAVKLDVSVQTVSQYLGE